MTIDEAIKHQRDMAEEYKFQLVLNETGHPMYALGDREISRIKKYVEEYTQVAEWLEELKHYKDIGSRFNKLVNDIPVYSEQLKEQDTEQYLCPGGYNKRTMSCDECEIPFCDYR